MKEVDHRLTEAVLLGGWGLEGHSLHAVWAADGEIGQLGRVVDAEVMRQTCVRRIQQHIPDRRAIRLAPVKREARGLLAEIHLDGVLERQMVRG